MSEDKWVFLTAGLGSIEYEAAARRVAADISEFNLGFETIVLTDKNLFELCPSFAIYSQGQDPSRTKGYGFWYWKAELVFRTLDRKDSPVQGVVWIDSGNEVFVSRWTKSKLLRMISSARNQGAVSYVLETAEQNYTKKEALAHFGNGKKGQPDYQFQANFFMLYGGPGRRIASEWFRNIEQNPHLLTDETDGVVPGFIGHRHDQSIFSLVCKSNEVQPAIAPPPTGHNGFKSIIKASFHPIWISRNRSGVSIKPKWLTNLGKVSLK